MKLPSWLTTITDLDIVIYWEVNQNNKVYYIILKVKFYAYLIYVYPQTDPSSNESSTYTFMMEDGVNYYCYVILEW